MLFLEVHFCNCSCKDKAPDCILFVAYWHMCGKLTVVNALTVNYLYSSYYSSTDTGQKVEERKGFYVLVWKETLIRDAILIKNHMKSILDYNRMSVFLSVINDVCHFMWFRRDLFFY